MKNKDIDQIFKEGFENAKEPYFEEYWDKFKAEKLSKTSSRSGWRNLLLLLLILLSGTATWFFLEVNASQNFEPRRGNQNSQSVSSFTSSRAADSIIVSESSGAIQSPSAKDSTTGIGQQSQLNVSTPDDPSPSHASVITNTSVNPISEKAESQSNAKTSDRLSSYVLIKPKELKLTGISQRSLLDDLDQVDVREIEQHQNLRFHRLSVFAGMGSSLNGLERYQHVNIGVRTEMLFNKRLGLHYSLYVSQRRHFEADYNGKVVLNYFTTQTTEFGYRLDRIYTLGSALQLNYRLINRFSLSAGFDLGWQFAYQGDAYKTDREGKKELLDRDFNPGVSPILLNWQAGLGYYVSPRIELGLNYKQGLINLVENDSQGVSQPLNEFGFQLNYHF